MGVGWEQGWVGKAKNELVQTRGRQAWGWALGGRGWQRQKRISGKHYFVVGLGQRQAGVGVGLGGRVGKGKNELVSDTNSFLPGAGYRGHFGSRYTLCLDKNMVKNLSLP